MHRPFVNSVTPRGVALFTNVSYILGLNIKLLPVVCKLYFLPIEFLFLL
jgi:hypothetical protein